MTFGYLGVLFIGFFSIISPFYDDPDNSGHACVAIVGGDGDATSIYHSTRD